MKKALLLLAALAALLLSLVLFVGPPEPARLALQLCGGLTTFAVFLAVFVGPFELAYRLGSVPDAADFPAPREKIAAGLLFLLLPVSAYVTAQSGYLALIAGPFLAWLVCSIVGGVAGRRPFLYTMIAGLLNLGVIVVSLYEFDGTAYNLDRDGVGLLVCLCLAVGCALLCATLLCWQWRLR